VKRLALLILLACASACGDSEKEAAPPPASAAPKDPPQMPYTGHRVEWGTPGVACQMKAGAKHPVSVIVRNVGDQFWHSFPATASGRGAIRLGARWWAPNDTKAPAIDYTPARGDLATNLGPGQSATLTVEVTAPPTPGSYLLQLDLVEELVVWFENTGATPLKVPVTVN
jgi:hypothetical protein